MIYIDPATQHQHDTKAFSWHGKKGIILAITGDAETGQYALVLMEKAKKIVPLAQNIRSVTIGASVQLWLGQRGILADGRVMHQVIAHAV